MNRRDFLKGAAGFWIAGAARGYGQDKSPNAKLNVAVVGVAGMRGADHLRGCASENIVALCDIDEGFLGKAAEKLPKASKWSDFREMLDKDKSIEAVCVSTPDHLHAPIGVAAMKAGKHLYSEKPLAHSLYEARTMRELAASKKVATQMGTQIHSGDNYRRVVELIRSGAIGKVTDVHVNLGGGRWSAGGWPKEDPLPAGLNWDLWTGPAAERPFSKGFHPAHWRKYWNYGGGDLADMGCHHIDLPFWALGLKVPKTCVAEGPPVNEVGGPAWLKVTWDFGDVKVHWTHGEQKPEIFTQGRLKWNSGNCFVGEKGMLFADYNQHKLWPEEKFVDVEAPKPTIPSSPGHHVEWINASKGGPPALCNFDYAGLLTECVLLGNVAYRTGKKIEWDSAALKAKNCPEADAFIRREYRKGWTL